MYFHGLDYFVDLDLDSELVNQPHLQRHLYDFSAGSTSQTRGHSP